MGDTVTVTALQRLDERLPEVEAQDWHTLLLSQFGPATVYPERREFDKEADQFVSELMRSFYKRSTPLSDREQVVSNVSRLIDEVNNGGFHQYFYNSSGDHALETARQLRAMGASETAGLVETGCSLFPDRKPAKDIERRRAQLEEFTVDQLEVLRDLNERFYSRREDVHVFVQEYWKSGP
jgi:hypothetical protein